MSAEKLREVEAARGQLSGLQSDREALERSIRQLDEQVKGVGGALRAHRETAKLRDRASRELDQLAKATVQRQLGF